MIRSTFLRICICTYYQHGTSIFLNDFVLYIFFFQTLFQFGGSRYEDVEKTKVSCTVLPDIECFGSRTFAREGVPCIRYSGHYFTTTLLYSILLGFLGMDRFCLGQTGTAVGKLLTLGGIGVWWIVDVILLVTNSLQPEDGSNWNPYV